MKIIKINEQQYRELLLNETLHYPEFLDKLKEDVYSHLCAKICEQIKKHNYSFEYVMQYKSEYTNEILFVVKINPQGDIKDKREYQCFYYNGFNQLYNGKLYQPKITVRVPCNKNAFVNLLLKTSLSHELTHLYDDWSELSRGKIGVNFNQKNVDTTKFIGNNFSKSNNDLLKKLAMLSYMSLNVEKQAFLSQTVQELESIGCNLYNYKEKLKETIIYNNLTKSYNGVCQEINNANEQTLRDCNQYIITLFPKANIPKLNNSDFNAPKYKNKLKQWSEKVFHDIMKNYGSVVQYYIDRLTEEENKTKSIFVM